MIAYKSVYYIFTVQAMLAKVQLEVASRSASFSPDGETLAVGLKNGSFVLISTMDMKTITKKRDRRKPISDIR